MKRKALALVLVLVMAVGLLPLSALAAAPHQLPEPVLAPAALPEAPAAPQADTYSIEMTSTGPGKAELYADTAGALESVYFLADPEPGYKVSFDNCGYYMKQHKMRLIYIGCNIYEIIMPDGDVQLDLQFVKITSDSHDVKLTVSAGGMASVDQTAAKMGESLFVEVITTPGYTLSSVRARSGGSWLEGYYMGKVDGAELYEVFMPDADVEILVDFTRNGPYTITPCVDTPGGQLKLSHQTAYELETVTVTAQPDRGYQVSDIGCFHSQLTKLRENVWTFAMPKFKEEVHVCFEPIVYPVHVTVEEPVGGTAVLDAEGATIGQTVTLTCLPDEGYRVARITGAELTPSGDNTYTFVMDAAPVELSVLFLRENNPFLDVTELDYFHDSVVWAAQNRITAGISQELFGPFETCNRSQVVTFLWRAAGSPAPQLTVNPFDDVPDDIWYADAVLWAVEKGITSGLTPTTFGPNDVCNRSQVVAFLHRAHGSRTPGLTEHDFTDVPSGAWYEKALLWALENKITSGLTANTFGPNEACSRSQVVTFLYRADRIPEPEPEPLPFPDLG